MNKNSNSFGIVFFVKKHRINSESQVPIYARVTVNSKRVEMSMKRWVSEKNWNQGKGMAKGSREEIVNLNNFLERFRARTVECYQELVLNRRKITPELIRDMVIGVDEGRHSLSQLMDFHNLHQKDQLAYGTMKNYYTTQNYIKEFVKVTYRTPDKFLSELSYKFITEFDYYLRNHRNKKGECTLSNNGVMKHLERFRKMINLGVQMEWLERNPFTAYKMKFEKVDRDYLTKGELAAVEDKEISIERLIWVRDLFVFSCYTGLAYIDVVNLRQDNLITGVDGELWIDASRQKTNTPIQMPILPKAANILKKYESKREYLPEGALLPVLSNQKLNSYLKEIADICGINKHLTFHTARHTFATTVTLSNGVPIESVSKMLGHTKLTTTQIYARVLETKLSADMAELKKKLVC